MRLQRPWMPVSPSLLALFLLSGAPVALGATITVNATADTQANDGKCTLREAILAAKNDVASGAATGECAAGEASPTVDTIAFNIPGSDSGCDGSGVCTITPGSALPSVGDYVTFDGYTQSGASVNTLAAGTNAVLKIVLSGAAAGPSALGLFLPGSHDTVRGLVINGFPTGIYGSSGGNHKVLGCFIGVNAAGTAAVTNNVGMVFNGTAGVTIGGTDVADRNLISGNGSGAGGAMQILASGVVIQGNLIGTNAAGTLAISNTYSGSTIRIEGTNDLIGGSAAGAGNVISGNVGGGIEARGTGGTGVTIQGNLIGTDAAGTGPLGNSNQGILAIGTVTVGGKGAGEANVVAFNGQTLGLSGVSVLGIAAAAIRGNSIYSNAGLGIDLGGTGVTLNDAGDTDTGPNNFQNFPVLTTASSTAGSTTIQGTLNSTASTDYDLDFFANSACDPSGYGEGETYLGSKTVTTDGSGNASFSTTFPVTVSPQARLTATATDPNGNTSEFCSCLSLQAKYHTITPCRVADTRTTAPPALAAGASRSFAIGGQCGIPADAQAAAFNFTITQPTAAGDLRIFTGGGTLPLVSAMNYRAGQTRANNGIVALGPSGDIVVHVDQASGTVQFVIDVNGYFE